MLRHALKFQKIAISIKKVTHDFGVSLDYYIAIFKEAFKLSLDKFKKHIENHPAVPLFKAIRCFDPHYIQSNFNYHAFSTYFVIKEFNNYSDNLMNKLGNLL